MTGRGEPGPVLRETGLVAIVRGHSGERLAAVCETLLEAGVRCLEITLNTPGALAAIGRLAGERRNDVEIGAGTVRRPEDVDAAADVGASFVVAPNTSDAVGQRAADRGLGWYPGALTPTEIEAAWNLGATAVKVFPAGSAGGPRYLREVRAPLDDVLLVPTGGVSVDDVPGFLHAGALAVGMGGPLIGRALEEDDDIGRLGDRARSALAAVARGRSRS